MKKYYAELRGDIAGIEVCIRFEDRDIQAAQDYADELAMDNYQSYDDPFNDEEEPLFYASVEVYNPIKHDKDFIDFDSEDDWEVLL